MAKIFGQLEKAQLENLASDPTPGTKGRFFINTTANVARYDNGTTIVDMGAGVTLPQKYTYVVSASSASGFTHTTIGAAITAASANDTILIMPGTYAENVSVSKRLFIEGIGYGAYINGTLTFTSGSVGSIMKGFRVATSITMNASSNYNQVTDFIIDAAYTAVVDNGTGNYLRGIATV